MTIRNTDRTDSYDEMTIRITDHEGKKTIYPPGIRNVLRFERAPYNLYMYLYTHRDSKGFFLYPIPPQNVADSQQKQQTELQGAGFCILCIIIMNVTH